MSGGLVYRGDLAYRGWEVPLGKTSSPAKTSGLPYGIWSFVDDDASESIFATGDRSGLSDYPYDGGYYSRLHPLFVAVNRYLLANSLIEPGEEIRPTECTYITGRMLPPDDDGTYGRRTRHLQLLQNTYNWDISNHSMSHYGYEGDTVLDVEARLEEEINESKTILEDTYGLNISTFVYPRGIHSHLIRQKVMEQHVCGIATGYTYDSRSPYNIPPFTIRALSRVTLDYVSIVDANGNCTNYATVLAAYKSHVDNIIAGKSWMITMSHSTASLWKNYNALEIDEEYDEDWIVPVTMVPVSNPTGLEHIVPDGWIPYPNTILRALYEAIIYLYEQGGRMMLPQDVITAYPNPREYGDVSFGVVGLKATEDELNYVHFAEGIDGALTAYRE